MRIRATVVLMSVLIASTGLVASGPLGIFGIVEKVVFEPDASEPERVQLWGVFGYVNGDAGSGISLIERGYLYFRLPNADEVMDVPLSNTLVRREWADLKAVAGTGQAVGFSVPSRGGSRVLWRIPPTNTKPYLVEFAPLAEKTQSYRVRAASETPTSPAEYKTDLGVVKLHPDGNRADLVQRLREALKQ